MENDTVRKRYLPVIWARYESRGSHPADLCHLTRLVEWRERYQEALAFRREYLDLLILTHSEGGESVDEDALGKLWNTLGKRYEIGDGVERNTSRALQCHRQAAELRNVESMSVYWRLSRACGPGPGLVGSHSTGSPCVFNMIALFCALLYLSDVFHILLFMPP